MARYERDMSKVQDKRKRNIKKKGWRIAVGKVWVFVTFIKEICSVMFLLHSKGINIVLFFF